VGLLRNRSTGAVLAGRVRFARGLVARYVGLLSRATVAPDEGLWFERAHAVHTLGMRAVVDVIFVDAEGRVVHCEPAVRPGRPSVSCAGAGGVVEMGAGFLSTAELNVGDVLALEADEV
jgi:uncharacterized membrane protein (UPF0127 family)